MSDLKGPFESEQRGPVRASLAVKGLHAGVVLRLQVRIDEVESIPLLANLGGHLGGLVHYERVERAECLLGEEGFAVDMLIIHARVSDLVE